MTTRMKIVIAALAMSTALLADRDAKAIFRALSCGTPTSGCPTGLTCTDFLGFTCVTSGAGTFSNCVNGYGGCFISTYKCGGTYSNPTLGACSCSGSDLAGDAC